MPPSFKTIPAALVCAGLACLGCTQQIAPRVLVQPKQFNIHIPFQEDSKGIMIATHWGAAKAEHVLYLDNHSPTWASNHVIKGNGSISKSNDFLYSTTTADGNTIEGDVYICDSIRIGEVNFTKVPFYNISNETNAGKTDGAIGENIMSEGVWKIDFTERLITFASSADSIKDLRPSDLLPAVFTSNGIEIETGFSNGVSEKLELDLGYNGCIILPEKDFRLIAAGNNQIVKDSSRFSTPGGFQHTQSEFIADTISIGSRQVQSFVSTNNLVKEKLIGLGFFKYFKFLVIDFINKKVYLPKKHACITCYE